MRCMKALKLNQKKPRMSIKEKAALAVFMTAVPSIVALYHTKPESAYLTLEEWLLKVHSDHTAGGGSCIDENDERNE